MRWEVCDGKEGGICNRVSEEDACGRGSVGLWVVGPK